MASKRRHDPIAVEAAPYGNRAARSSRTTASGEALAIEAGMRHAGRSAFGVAEAVEGPAQRMWTGIGGRRLPLETEGSQETALREGTPAASCLPMAAGGPSDCWTGWDAAFPPVLYDVVRQSFANHCHLILREGGPDAQPHTASRDRGTEASSRSRIEARSEATHNNCK